MTNGHSYDLILTQKVHKRLALCVTRIFIVAQKIKSSCHKYCRRAAILHDTTISKCMRHSWEISSIETDFFLRVSRNLTYM